MRATALARTLEAWGAKVPHLCPISRGQGFTTWSQHRYLIPSSKSGQKSGFHPRFSMWATNSQLYPQCVGQPYRQDPAYRLPIFNLSTGGSSAFKGREMPREREKIRCQHAGRNKDAQSQLRRNSQASTGIGMTKGQHFKMRRVKESSVGKGEL